jgi:hypothetical protein
MDIVSVVSTYGTILLQHKCRYTRKSCENVIRETEWRSSVFCCRSIQHNTDCLWTSDNTSWMVYGIRTLDCSLRATEGSKRLTVRKQYYRRKKYIGENSIIGENSMSAKTVLSAERYRYKLLNDYK